jgi:hypothetical protein
LRSDPSGKLAAAASCLLLGLALSFPSAGLACPNDAARSGASARLPDCRAYELVTPRDTGGALPVGTGSLVANPVSSPSKRLASPPAISTGSFVYSTFGTALPDTDGGGLANAYRASRAPDGWESRLFGPSGLQAAASTTSGFSGDQSHLAFYVHRFEDRFSGTLAIGAGRTSYLRAADGDVQLVGEGTLPVSPDEDGNPNGLADESEAVVAWIAPGGDHVVFGQGEQPVRLLAESPPEGVRGIYDRTPAGLRLVSLLPEGEPAPTDSSFEGASADGSTILFRTGDALFARVDGSRTEEIGSGLLLGAGVSDDGRFVFLAEDAEDGGNLFRYDTRSGTTATIAGSGDARFVNVAADGSHAYFESPSLLDGDNGAGGAPNIYVWDGGAPRFVATVMPLDLARPETRIGTVGLTQWVTSSLSSPARNGDVIAETSRLTADGRVFVFESTAGLTGFDPGGQVEIYRYDDSSGQLACVSCGRLWEPPSAGAELADYELVASGPNAVLGNLSADGGTVFFQSDEALLSTDVNGVTDVYEWHEGSLSLISSGRSGKPSLLMGASADGRDVFFRTSEQLLGAAQQEATPAIYDARVGGGFPSAPLAADPCQSMLCGTVPADGAADPEPASALLAAPRRPRVHRRNCPRRRRAVRPKRCGHHRGHRHDRHVRRGRG